MDIRSVKLAVRPPGHAEGSPPAWEARNRLKTSAAHRSAAMAGGARPDPFRTRKLSRRAPMVLRGQPVGEQGAADRWTALDPYVAGSGAGAPRGGTPPRRPLSFFSISFSRGPSGALFSCRGGGCDCGPDGAIHIDSGGRTAPSPRRAPFPPGPFSPATGRSPRREPRGRAPGPGGPAAACRSGRPARSRRRRPGVRPVRWPFRSARAVSPASRASLSAGPRPRRPGRAPGRVLRAP